MPEQDLLLPPSLREWLPENHLAYFVSDLVDHLDLSAITAVYEEDERGYPPYHPVMLTKLLIYGYCVGVFSSRRIQRRLIEDVAFRVLAAGNEPDFRTIADFRKRHLPALQGFFEQVLGVARDLGTLRVGRIALDGTKVKANASKHKAMSYGRMKDKARQLREEVKQLLAHAEATDAAEDAESGVDVRGDELPAELQRRESRLKRIREATRALKARAKEEAAAAGQPVETAKPDPKAQYNFTDPESRIMKGPDGFVQAYNGQVAVNEDQLIIGQAVTQETNDKKQLMPMIMTMEQQAGDTPPQLPRGSLELKDHAGGGAAEIELQIAERQSEDFQVLETVKIPDVPANADRTKHQHQTAADVPSEIVVLDRSEATERGLDARFDQTDADERVRAHRTDPRRDHHVAHEGQHARGRAWSLTKEVFRVGQFLFEADDAGRPNRHAKVRPLVLAVRNLPTARVASKVVADKRTDEALRIRCRRRDQHQSERTCHPQEESRGPSHGHRCHLGTRIP